MSRYAEGTAVSPSKSRQEIDRTLSRYGVEGIGIAVHGRDAAVSFIHRGRQYRVRIEMLDHADPAWRRTPTGRRRSASEAHAAAAAEERRLWRCLLLTIKAKLEAVSSGVISFEQEWLPYAVLPDGRTVADHALPGVAQAYRTGVVPQLVPGTPTAAIESGTTGKGSR